MNYLFITKMRLLSINLKSNDNYCLCGLELIGDDLLFNSKKYIYSKFSPRIVRLIQTSQNAYVLDIDTQWLRASVYINPENVEMLMTSSTIIVVFQIFNNEITKLATEHAIHILHVIYNFSLISLTNSLNYLLLITQKKNYHQLC